MYPNKKIYCTPEMEMDTIDTVDILTESITAASYVENNQAESAMTNRLRSPWKGSGQ